jgi:hypothetical protein
MFRIEVRHQTSDRWGPALMPSIGTNLTPERASTFETAQVAFEKCRDLGKLQPTARYRVVEAASGVVIWGSGHNLENEEHRGRAVYLNGGPADFVETGRLTRSPRPPNQLAAASKGPALVIDSVAPGFRGMSPEAFAHATLIEQIVLAQEEFVAGMALLRGNDLTPRAIDGIEEGLAAAQEILTNLRELAKRLGDGR